MSTYFIYKEDKKLYDKKLFYSVVKLKDYFHENYFKEKGWLYKYGKNVTFSNDQRLSAIKNTIPGILEYCDKAKLYKNLDGKPYMPEFINFSIENDNWYEKEVQKHLVYDDSIWFLKKSNHITYGGFDVFPLKTSKHSFHEKLKMAIEESNHFKKYYSPFFSLQKGISNLFLTNDGKKFDFRSYGLMVWINGKIEFYYYNSLLLRKNPNIYDQNSEDRTVQLTNTTFNRVSEDMSTITELVTKDHPYWKMFFMKTKDIYEDICSHVKSNKNIIVPKDGNGYHLIGLDFIPDKDENIFLLEINKHPAIYYDEKIDSLHKGMERTMFRFDNFYQITFEAFEKKDHWRKKTPNFYYCRL